MENTVNQSVNPTVAPSPRKRRFKRLAFFALFAGCSLFGVVALVAMLQSRSQAQWAEQQARHARQAISPIQVQNGMPGQPNNQNFNYPQANAYYAPQNNNPNLSGSGYNGQYPYQTGPVSSYSSPNPSPVNAPFNAPSNYGSRADAENRPVLAHNPDTNGYDPTPKTSPSSFPFIGLSNTGNNEEPQIESQILQLANQFRGAEAGNKESISQTLSQKLSELFDARHKAQSARVEALKSEVQQTQELLDKRLQLKSKIVERRVKELTGQQDELSWNASVPNSNFHSNPVPLSMGFPSPGPTVSIPRQMDFPVDSAPRANWTLSPGFTQIAPIQIAPSQLAPSQLAPSESLPMPMPNELPSGSIPSVVSSQIEANPPVLSNVPFLPNVPTENASNHFNPMISGPGDNKPPNAKGLESQRSFISIGFKLKGLKKDLEEEKKNDGNWASSKTAAALQNAIEETKALWDFEKSALESELETVESEYQIVVREHEHAELLLEHQQKLIDANVASKLDYSEAEVLKLKVDRQLLQLRSRIATIKKSLVWMESFFKEKPLEPTTAY